MKSGATSKQPHCCMVEPVFDKVVPASTYNCWEEGATLT